MIRTFLYQSHRLCFKTTIMPSPDLYRSILINIDQLLINIDQDFSLPKSQTLFQNNYYAESWSIYDQYWSILINIDQYWSILFRTFLYQSHRLSSKQLLSRLLINFDQYRSILINIDQYWSGIFFTKVTDSVSKQLLCRVLIYIDQYWSILINIDQYWSILFRTFLYQSHRLSSKQLLSRLLINFDQYRSILINIDQYWSILIRTFPLPKSETLFQNNY